jgi:hypothetical protein
MVAPTTALFLGMSATLVVSAVLQLYPTYKYAQNVLYPRGVKLLSASLLALVVGWLTNDLVSYGVVDAAVLRTVAQASFTTASTLFLWANWEFASDFVRLTEESEFDTPAGDPTAGFEGAGTDDAGVGASDRTMEVASDADRAETSGATTGPEEVFGERRD